MKRCLGQWCAYIEGMPEFLDRKAALETVPEELRRRDDHRFSYLSIPESCRRKRMVPALLALPRRIRRLLRKHRGTSSMAALQKTE